MDLLLKCSESDIELYLNGVIDAYLGRNISKISNHDILKSLPSPDTSQFALMLIKIFEKASQLTDINQLNAEFSDKVSPSILQCIIKICLYRQNEILNEAKKRSILAGLPNYLNDFDWSLRLIMSSSKLQSTRIPIVMLTLYIKNDNKMDEINLELNKNELNSFIDSLSNAHNIINKIDKSMKNNDSSV
mmetsp:Transcript_43223/g.53091  ORF Transcript_43223/g.53091 Transcript_43223/m.53091 type:complete len:189 (+) Transcript_43223:299-865(+)